MSDKIIKKINDREVSLSNLDKVFWPQDGYTKGDLIEYYENISPYILPYLKSRPESMHRQPNGIKEEGFYQKDTKDLNLPKWVKSKVIYSKSEDRNIRYLLCEGIATLVYAVNLGCIEFNPWNSRIGKLNFPDYMIIDLDPYDTGFSTVVRVAMGAKIVLDRIGLKSFIKTSGATGLHIFIPLDAKYYYEQTREFCHLVCIAINHKLPRLTSLERNPAKRKGLVYLDYLQNLKGQTIASVYCVRPRIKAPVSTPLKWTEVKTGLRPENFHIKNIFKRLKKYGDLWDDLLVSKTDMALALDKVQYFLKKI